MVFQTIPLKNQLKEYTVYYNDGKSEVKSFEDKHRLSYEFKEFIRMIKEKDLHIQCFPSSNALFVYS